MCLIKTLMTENICIEQSVEVNLYTAATAGVSPHVGLYAVLPYPIQKQLLRPRSVSILLGAFLMLPSKPDLTLILDILHLQNAQHSVRSPEEAWGSFLNLLAAHS